MFLFGPPNIEKMKACRDVKGLIKALGYQKDSNIRRDAARALGEIGDKSAVEPLIAALKDKESGVRRAAAEALGKIKDARAVEPLITALKNLLYVGVPIAAASALGEIGDARAVEPLIAVFQDSDKDVRKAAAEALGKIGDARAVEPLIAALMDSNEHVRRAAAEALDHLGWKPRRDENAAWYLIAKKEWEKCVALGALAVKPLKAALRGSLLSGGVGGEVITLLNKGYDSVAFEQMTIAISLAKLGHTEPMLEQLRSLLTVFYEQGIYGDLVEKYVGILGEIKSKEAIPLLSHFLRTYRSSRYAIRGMAARITEALGKIGSPDCVMPLIQALDGEYEVKKSAARSLVQLYRQTELPEALKQEILLHQHEIIMPHDDYFDSESCEHHDKGIGIEFPL